VYYAVQDGWDITVTSVNAGPHPSGQGAFVDVKLTALNSGKESHSLGSNRFKLRDAQSRAWRDLLTETVGALANLGLQPVQPGFSTEVELSFQVPADTKGLWLETIGGGRIDLGGLDQTRFVPAR